VISPQPSAPSASSTRTKIIRRSYVRPKLVSKKCTSGNFISNNSIFAIFIRQTSSKITRLGPNHAKCKKPKHRGVRLAGLFDDLELNELRYRPVLSFRKHVGYFDLQNIITRRKI